MSKSRPQVKNKLDEWRDWLINHVPKPIKDHTSKAFKTFKDKVMGLYDRVTTPASELTHAGAVGGGGGGEEPFTPYQLEQAFGRALRSFRIDGRPRMDAETFFRDIRRSVTDLISRELRELNSARVQTTAWICFRIEDEDADGNTIIVETVDRPFNSRMMEVFHGSDLNELIDQMFAHMRTQVENPALMNSRFVFDQVLFLDVNFNQLNLTRGSSYIPLPDWISHKKAVINPRNEGDEECFKWAVIAGLHHEDITSHPERISNHRRFENNYDWSGVGTGEDFVGEDWKVKNWGELEFPVPLNSIVIFERSKDVLVNVLVVEGEGKFYILKKSKFVEGRKVVDLLLLEDGKKRHYAAIKNLSRLLGSSNSRDGHQQHICRNCLQGFHSEATRNKHFEYCKDNEVVKIEMPTEKPFVKFDSGQCQFEVPFVIYVDFDTILQNVEEETNPDSQAPYTRKINHHVPSGFCTYSTFTYGKVKDPLYYYRGEDCVEVFCDHLEEEAKRLYHMFPPNKPMDPLTPTQAREFRRARRCHICMYPFKLLDLKVRDHCHHTGKYRGAAHEMCNLQYAIPNFIPIVFHNLSGYDAHMFIRELGEKFDSGSIDVIAENKEKYISFGVKVVVDEREIPGSKEKITMGNEMINRGKTEGEEEMIAEGKKLVAEGERKKKIYRKL